MKNYNVFNEFPINSIKPSGWLKNFLELQSKGLTGNLECAGFPFDEIGWDRYSIDTSCLNENPQWWVYEQTAYWVDGMERCGQLINDKKLLEKAQKSFDYTLDNSGEDGYIGPYILKDYDDPFAYWSHVVFFRALMARYSATKDKRILDKITDFYLKFNPDFSKGRNVLNVEIMLWAYMQSGNVKLLEMAEDTYKRYNENCNDDNCVAHMLSRKKPYVHGVTYNEFCKLGAILYSCTGNKEYLKPVINAYKKMERMHMLIDGAPCSNEFMIDNDYMQSHETCDVTDYTWTLGYLFMATGDGKYADMIEKCVLNAGIGSVLEDFKGLQYFSCPNQVIADAHSNHNDFFKGEKWMSYRPNPGTECCAGNVNRFFPNYCARMWMQAENSVCAVFYGDSEIDQKIADSVITIKEKTAYPFEDSVKFEFAMDADTKFKFSMRIPSWCKNATVKLNGKCIDLKNVKGIATLERLFKNGDIIQLDLPSEIELKNYKDVGCYVEKGALLYTYGIKGERIIDTDEAKSTPEFPAYNIYPEKPWNYAFSIKNNAVSSLKACKHKVEDNPWDVNCPAITIPVTVRRVNGWDFEKRNRVSQIYRLYKPVLRRVKKGEYVMTPRLPQKELLVEENLGKKETVNLVPYGSAKLRLTIFPKCK